MTANDQSPDDLLELAHEALEDGSPEMALELCHQLLDRDPSDIAAWFLGAEALRDLREVDDAESSYRRVIDLDPGHAAAWSGLGHALFDQRRFDDALACHQRALRIEPDHADAAYGRALIRERRGDAAGARRDYLRACAGSSRYNLPLPLPDEAIRQVALDAAESVDPMVAAWLGQVPVLIRDLPDDAVCEAYDPPASPAELLGHLAAAMPGDEEGSRVGLPPALVLFRKNIERFAATPDELEELLQAVVIEAAEWLGGSIVEA